jgi:hypothetical protein
MVFFKCVSSNVLFEMCYLGYGVMIGSHERERTKAVCTIIPKSRVPRTKDQTEVDQERSLL